MLAALVGGKHLFERQVAQRLGQLLLRDRATSSRANSGRGIFGPIGLEGAAAFGCRSGQAARAWARSAALGTCAGCCAVAVGFDCELAACPFGSRGRRRFVRLCICAAFGAVQSRCSLFPASAGFVEAFLGRWLRF